MVTCYERCASLHIPPSITKGVIGESGRLQHIILYPPTPSPPFVIAGRPLVPYRQHLHIPTFRLSLLSIVQEAESSASRTCENQIRLKQASIIDIPLQFWAVAIAGDKFHPPSDNSNVFDDSKVGSISRCSFPTPLSQNHLHSPAVRFPGISPVADSTRISNHVCPNFRSQPRSVGVAVEGAAQWLASSLTSCSLCIRG